MLQQEETFSGYLVTEKLVILALLPFWLMLLPAETEAVEELRGLLMASGAGKEVEDTFDLLPERRVRVRLCGLSPSRSANDRLPRLTWTSSWNTWDQ